MGKAKAPVGDEPGATPAAPETPPLPFLEEPAHPAASPPSPAAAEPDPGPDDWEPPSREEWEAHEARVAEAEEQTRTARAQTDQNTSLVRELLGSRPGGAAAAAPDPTPPDPGAMPDPARDPAEFATWLNARDAVAEHKFNASLRGIQADIHQNARANDLFAEFVTQHPEVADKRDLLEFAARRSGLRPGDSKETIFAAVTAELTKLGLDLDPQPAGDPPPGTGGTPPLRPRAPRAVGGRTGGVGGGSGARPRRRAEPDEVVTDLVDQISEDQVRMGVM